MEIKDNIKHLACELKNILKNAPYEENCNNIENEMYSNMQNLLESIQNYIKLEVK